MFDCFLPTFLKPISISQNDLIRLGRRNDGGYVISKEDILKSKTLISLGINDDWSFEKNFLALNENTRVVCFDGSISLNNFFKILLKNILFFRLKMAINSFFLIKSFLSFFSKKEVSFINQHVGNFKTNNFYNLNVSQYGYDIFLKIDIEGSEYRLLDKILRHQKRLRGIAIEFHDFDINIKRIKKFVQLLNLNLINVNVNNYGEINDEGIPTVVEVSFSRSKNSQKKEISNSWANLNQKNSFLGYDVNLLFKEIN